MKRGLPDNLTIIDVETTGLSPVYDRVIEVGVIRLEKGKKVAVFESFVNPHRHLPPEITRITGITPSMLEGAPDFTDIRRSISDLLEGSVLVAHNAGFDYAFLSEEYKRIESEFSYPSICTVRLFRHLYPGLPSYGLDSLISYFGISVANRHRALGDAKVLVSFLNIAKKQARREIPAAITAATSSIPVPVYINDRKTNPDNSPGVYTFIGKNGMSLYIGKSIKVRSRLLSHFRSHQGISKQILQQTDHITVNLMPGEVSALLREQHLIKNQKPLHNRQLRIANPFILVSAINRNGYFYFQIQPMSSVSTDQVVYGPFPSKRKAADYIRETARISGLCEEIILGKNPKRACLPHQLGECSGACTGKVKPAKFNMAVITAFSDKKISAWPYPRSITYKEQSGNCHAVFTISKWVIEKVESNVTIIPKPELGKFNFDIYMILRKKLL